MTSFDQKLFKWLNSNDFFFQHELSTQWGRFDSKYESAGGSTNHISSKNSHHWDLGIAPQTSIFWKTWGAK